MIAPAVIIDAVAEFRGVGRSALLGHNKERRVSWPRHELVFCLRNLTDLSIPHIGREVNGRDSSTILNSLRRVDERWCADLEYAREIERLLVFVRNHQAKFQDPECLLERARRIVVNPASATAADAVAMSAPLLTLNSLFTTDQLTDAEARKAATATISGAY